MGPFVPVNLGQRVLIARPGPRQTFKMCLPWYIIEDDYLKYH